MRNKPANLVKQFNELSSKDKVRFWNIFEHHVDKSALGISTVGIIDLSCAFISLLTTSYKTPDAESLAHFTWAEADRMRQEFEGFLQDNEIAPTEYRSAIWQRLGRLIEFAGAATQRHLALSDRDKKRSKQTSTKRERVNSLVIELLKKGATRKRILNQLKKGNLKTERKKIYDHRSLSKLIQRLDKKNLL